MHNMFMIVSHFSSFPCVQVPQDLQTHNDSEASLGIDLLHYKPSFFQSPTCPNDFMYDERCPSSTEPLTTDNFIRWKLPLHQITNGYCKQH